MDGESQAPGEDAPAGVHDLLQLNPPAVEGIVHHLASTMRIPEILRLRQVWVGFAVSVQVKKITMEYSREVRGIIQQASDFNLPDEIFLPRITVHNNNNRRALENLLGLQPYMTVVLTNPTGSVRALRNLVTLYLCSGLACLPSCTTITCEDNLWYPPPTCGICPNMAWTGITMAQLLTEVGEQPVVLKCMIDGQLFWCDKCKKWDDDPCGAVAKHRAKVECGSS